MKYGKGNVQTKLHIILSGTELEMETRIFIFCKYLMKQIGESEKEQVIWEQSSSTEPWRKKDMFVNLLFVPNRGFVMLIFDKK